MSARATLQDAQEHLGQAAAALLNTPGVLTVGVGFRRRGEVVTDEPCFVVGVRAKGNIAPGAELPATLMGIGVDVQEVSEGRLLASVAGAGQCRARGREERGQVAMLARRGDAVWALTALHVLVRERDGLAVEGSSLFGMIVEAQTGNGDFARVGELVAGGYDAHRDVAAIRVDETVEKSDRLVGTSVRLREPLPVSTHIIGIGVEISIATEAPIDGTLVEWPVIARFRSESGPMTFVELAKFALKTPRIRGGWSGSAVFTKSGHPLALLSVGADAPDRNGVVHAYGFPLAAHWDLWGLAPFSAGEST